MATVSMTDDESIKYYNLNFPSKGEADAWLDLHAPGGNFGFVIDFHTLQAYPSRYHRSRLPQEASNGI